MKADVRTRAVDRSAFRNYLKKASEFHDAMETSHAARAWNACVVNAIHCAISCADALTVFYLGFRHSGEKHQDASRLLQGLEIDRGELKAKTRQLLALLSIKNAAEYEERLMDQRDAENARKTCDRLYSWTKEKLE